MNETKDPVLFIPGPVTVAKPVLKAQSRPMVNHRGKSFASTLSSIHANLQKLYGTNCQSSQSKVFMLTCSGTGAVEAAMLNVIEQTDRVLCIDNGAFGARLPASARFWSSEVVGLQFPWGKAPDLAKVKAAVEEFKPTVLVMVHNDTSTGVVNPVEKICKIAKDASALTVVDSVSGLGGSTLEFDAWGVDACASASQKCMGGTPGAGFVALSKAAWDKVSNRKAVPSFYFDLRKYDDFFSKSGQTPFTPSESVYFGLEIALNEYFRKGLAYHIGRHKSAGKLVRKTLVSKGYTLFAQDGYGSNTLTTFNTQDALALRERLLQSGYEISAGMGEYKNTVGRIGHMGSFSRRELTNLLELL